jgi:hypothetical protein
MVYSGAAMKWLVKIRVRSPLEDSMKEVYSSEREMMYAFPLSIALAFVGWWQLEAKIVDLDTEHCRGYSR